MITIGLLFLAQDVPTKYQKPVKAVEWVDQYNKCLNTSATALIEQRPELDRKETGKRATVRCWPTRASARKAILSELSYDEDHSFSSLHSEMANRLLDSAVKAFAMDFGLSIADLGPLDPPRNP